MNRRQAKKRKLFIEEKNRTQYPFLIKSWSHIRWSKQIDDTQSHMKYLK